MSLRDWSPWRIAIIWVAWPASLILAFIAAGAVTVWRADARAVRARVALPRQYSDFSVQFDNAPVVLAFWCGPPLLLTLVWLWRRSRRGAT